MSNGVTTGPRAQRRVSFKGVQRSKTGSHREEEFQEQKDGRSSKDSRCSQLLTEPLIQLLRTEYIIGQPDQEEEDKAS